MSGRNRRVEEEKVSGKRQTPPPGQRDVVLPRPVLTVGQEVAWVAIGWVDVSGHRVAPDQAALAIIAVSVNAAFPTDIGLRLELLHRVAARALASHPRLAEIPTLWVYPGGYFGFDAWSWGFWKLDDDPPPGTWSNLQPADIQGIRAGLGASLAGYPRNATIAFGVDLSMNYPDQYAWIVGNGGLDLIPPIQRGNTDIPARRFHVGRAACAAFVCGEGTGSWSAANGPFFANQHLDAPAIQLQNVHVLADLSHAYVPKTRTSPTKSNYCPHQRAWERFSRQGAALMSHHHDGQRYWWDHTNWVIFNGAGAHYTWVPENEVLSVVW